MRRRECYSLVLAVAWLLGALSACAKKGSEELYTNCKLAAKSGPVAIGGFPRNSNRIPSTGTAHVTVIMVDFPDSVATQTPAQAYAKISGATATFAEQSYGRLTFAMTPVLQWFRLSQSSAYYKGSKLFEYAQEAVSVADSTVDFSNTDLLVVLQNPDSTDRAQGPTMPRSPGQGITADGKEILNIITSGYDLNSWGSIWLNHESTHAMGLVDLYNYSPVTNTAANLLPFTGGFSYMGYNSFNSNAPGLTAWERWVLGWLDDSQVLCSNPKIDGQINTSVVPLESSGGRKAVMVPVSLTKVVVVESRRASGIDANIAKTGALVYTVDSSIDSGYGPIQVRPKGSETDPLFTSSPRAAGESVTVEGITVEVLSSDAQGDSVRISSSPMIDIN